MAAPKRVYRCVRCNRPFRSGEDRIHSEWSGNSYCIEVDLCAFRASGFKGRVPIVWRAPKWR